MLRTRVLGAALVAVVAVSAAGCGKAADQVPAGAAASADSRGAPAAKAPDALRFTGKTLDGADFSGESLAGKAVVLWFWTPWCPRCQGEAPNVAKLAKERAGKVTFVGVAAQDQLPAMRQFVTKFGVDGFSHLADPDAVIWKKFGVTQQPAYAFVTPDGVVDVVKQQLTESALTSRVNILVDG